MTVCLWWCRRAWPGAGDVTARRAEAVDVLAGDPSDGVLVPASLASAYELEPGSVVVLGLAEVRVGAVYRDVWDGDLSDYWEALPSDLRPEFLRMFNRPSFELVIAPESTVRSLGLAGLARWDAPLARAPSTWAGFQQLVHRYRLAESALNREGPLNAQLSGVGPDPEIPAFVFTAAYPAEVDAAQLVGELEQPIRAASWLARWSACSCRPLAPCSSSRVVERTIA
ncbi:MAG: hypothetical protein R2706_11540 [Acidimicrobiales bacterium]